MLHLSFCKECARSVRGSVIYRTLTWTTGSLTCARDHSYACVYVCTRGLGTPTASQHNIIAPGGVRTSGHEILSPTHYQLSQPHSGLCSKPLDVRSLQAKRRVTGEATLKFQLKDSGVMEKSKSDRIKYEGQNRTSVSFNPFGSEPRLSAITCTVDRDQLLVASQWGTADAEI